MAIRFIKTTHWKDDENENKDGYEIVYEDLLYSRYRINKLSINYHCKTKLCKSSLTINKTNHTIIHFTEHTDVLHQKLTNVDNFRKK